MSYEESNKFMRDVCLSLNFGNDSFFEYMENHRIKRLNDDETNIFSWGTFYSTSDYGFLDHIRMLVPFIVNEKTLLINIHEYYHAFRLFNCLYSVIDYDYDLEQNLAISKENEYLTKKAVCK